MIFQSLYSHYTCLHTWVLHWNATVKYYVEVPMSAKITVINPCLLFPATTRLHSSPAINSFLERRDCFHYALPFSFVVFMYAKKCNLVFNLWNFPVVRVTLKYEWSVIMHTIKTDNSQFLTLAIVRNLILSKYFESIQKF